MGLFADKFETLRDLYVNELRDLHSAELQLITAIPKMAEAASSSQLKNALTTHLEQTRGHVRRLEQIFNALGEKPSGKTCQAMEGLIAEGEGYAKASGDDSVRDAGLIGAAQRVEHYEMAGYGTARSLANRLGEKNASSCCRQHWKRKETPIISFLRSRKEKSTSLPPVRGRRDAQFLTTLLCHWKCRQKNEGRRGQSRADRNFFYPSRGLPVLEVLFGR